MENAYAVDDVTTTVYGSASFTEKNYANPGSFEGYKFVYSGTDIRIDKGIIQGLKANTTTEVTVTNPAGSSAKFKVNVANRAYVSKHAAVEESEGWFKDVSVAKISSLTSSFANGIDISSAAYLYERNARFYNDEGNEQSLFQILKEHGVNWVRLRLWVDPYNHNFTKNGAYVSYGGGCCDLTRVRWMAKEAVSAGLKYLLDFHYSDFYTDPSHQIIPKAWASLTSASAMKDKIYEYTKATLETLKSDGVLPEAVQVGNELTRGLLTQVGGTDSANYTGGDPLYTSNCTNAASAVSGAIGTTNFHDYVKAAAQAVKDVSVSIKVMIHFAKGFSAVSTLETWFDSLGDVSYDIVGVSGYCYWHWSSKSVLTSTLSELSSHYPSKKICIAETAYGFTYETASNLSAIFSKTGTATATAGYAVSVQGQANLVHDVTEAVASLSNGFGVFYWEGAWTVRSGAGWADLNSDNSWANQALFSYDGKALSSLSVYKQIQGL
jgi:arabinogalactan endo-1,4-beta-galactosidase